jgi:hypothetical protein
MKLLINIFKFIIFILYFLQLLPYLLIILILNVLTNLIPPFGHNKPDWVIKINTHFIYYTCNILLRNHTNQFLIYFILKLQHLVLNFRINTGLILCQSKNVHQGRGLLLKFQAYPQPLEIYNVYFAI